MAARQGAAQALESFLHNDNIHVRPSKFDFTRTGAGAYIDAQGNLKFEPRDNFPRVSWRNGRPYFVSEISQQNLFVHTNDFTQTEWSKASTGNATIPVITPNYAISPTGEQNATRVQMSVSGNTSGDRSLLRQILTRNTNPHTLEFWIKSTPGAGTQKLSWHFTGNPVETFEVNEGEWIKYSYTAAGSTLNTFYGLELQGSTTDKSVDIIIYQASIVESSFGTTDIINQSSINTRGLESFVSTDQDKFINPNAGIFHIDLGAGHDFDGNAGVLFQARQDNNNRFNIYFSGGIARFFGNDAGVSQFNQQLTQLVGSIGGLLSIVYSTTKCELWLNGYRLYSLGRLSAFNYNEVSFSPNSLQYYHKIEYYDALESDIFMQELGAYADFQEAANAQNFTIV